MNNKKPIKPLSCFYCDNSTMQPGQHRTSFARFKSAFVLCQCLTASPDLFVIYDKRHGQGLKRLVAWMPYKCGHFVARIIRVKCAHRPCTTTLDMPEWLAAKRMYVESLDALCCSDLCVEIHQKELIQRQARLA